MKGRAVAIGVAASALACGGAGAPGGESDPGAAPDRSAAAPDRSGVGPDRSGALPDRSGADTLLRVLSFNIRYDEPRDGVHAWPRRADRVARLIRELAPDAAGLQEALVGQVRDLAAALPAYEWIGVGRDDGAEGGEFSPIFYRHERLERLETGTFWLSPDPGRPGSVGWDAALPRIATWARFRDRETGRRLILLNAHFDHRGARARVESARLLRKRAGRLAGRDPVVVLGDLNAGPDDPPLRVLAAAGGRGEAGAPRPGERGRAAEAAGPRLCDARILVAEPAGPEGTFSGFEAGEPPSRRIDYVLVGRGVTVLGHEHVVDVEEGAYPSDHLPVMADLRIPPAGEAGGPGEAGRPEEAEAPEGAGTCASGS